MKKGFTLIELLAVIIILAIIALITTPIILNVVSDARLNSKANSTSGIMEAVKLAYAQNQSDKDLVTLPFTIDLSGEMKLPGTDRKIIYSGEKPTSGKIIMDQNGTIVAEGVKFDNGDYVCGTTTDTKVECSVTKDNTASKIIANKGTTGVVEDPNVTGRYVYKGADPKNRIMLKEGSTEVLYRIVSIETDGTLKVIRDEKVINSPWDSRTTETTGPRLNGNNTYCQLYSDGKYYGCNAWSAVSGTYTNGQFNGTVNQDSTIKDYLNNTFYNTLADETKNIITDHSYNNGGVTQNWGTGTGMSLAQLTTNQMSNVWNGKIGLVTVSDWFNATTNASCVHETNGYYNTTAGTAYPCSVNNYLHKTGYWWWTISPYLGGRRNVFIVHSPGFVNYTTAGDTSGGVRPAFYLKSTINLSGTGTSSDPYKLK